MVRKKNIYCLVEIDSEATDFLAGTVDLQMVYLSCFQRHLHLIFQSKDARTGEESIGAPSLISQ